MNRCVRRACQTGTSLPRAGSETQRSNEWFVEFARHSLDRPRGSHVERAKRPRKPRVPGGQRTPATSGARGCADPARLDDERRETASRAMSFVGGVSGGRASWDARDGTSSATGGNLWRFRMRVNSASAMVAKRSRPRSVAGPRSDMPASERLSATIDPWVLLDRVALRRTCPGTPFSRETNLLRGTPKSRMR